MSLVGTPKTQDKGFSAAKYSCLYCTEIFSAKDRYKRHLSKVHSNVMPRVECDLCEKLFKTYDTMIRHKRYAHSDDRPHPCDLCGKDFKYRSNMLRHRQR